MVFFSAVLLLLPDERNFHSYENLITFISKGVIEFWCSPYEHHLYNLAGNQKPFDNPRNQTALHGLIVLICSWNFTKVCDCFFISSSLLFLIRKAPEAYFCYVFPRPVSSSFPLNCWTTAITAMNYSFSSLLAVDAWSDSSACLHW